MAELAIIPTQCVMKDYRPAVHGCTPSAVGDCGRVVVDEFASGAEVAALAGIADRAMRLGGGSGGPTILDLASGALSYRDRFIDVWSVFNSSSEHPPFRRSELREYADITDRVRHLAERVFGVRGLHLTSPCFFSRIGDKKPTISNDEYWHPHVDTQQYGSFMYTALLYLSDADVDFDGGELHFLHRGSSSMLEQPVAKVRPAKGRLVLFTSGSEHPHRVTQVTRGARLTLTIPFTCNAEAAIGDPIGRAAPDV